MYRSALTVAALTGTIALAGCGSTAANAPDGSAVVQSSTDSGNPAIFGTKGVEVEVINGTSSPFYVWERAGGEVRTLGSKGSTTFQGESSIVDDVELAASWNNNSTVGVEMDASNPSVGLPNMSIYSTSSKENCASGLEVGGYEFCNPDVNGESTWVGFVRLTDTSDNKRFSVMVCGSGGIMWDTYWGKPKCKR